MKLAAIYNVWDGDEFLPGSILCLGTNVDLIVIVYQNVSNFGEPYRPLLPTDIGVSVIRCQYTPEVHGGAHNEIAKRNLGLDIARAYNCTHFLHLDTDEYYENFATAKNLYIQSGADGSACKIFTYFKRPTLRFETEDGYFVPFIHKLLPETQAGGEFYPIYVDPTRRINCKNVELLNIHMHHFSWVRLDINRKTRNSSARRNIARGTMLESYNDSACGDGYYVKDYDKKLITVEDLFGLNKIFV